MNSAHDMGGMHGMGPIVPEADYRPFHHEWEGRVLALFLAMGAWGKWNIDRGRLFRESVPGPRYLNITYFEIWLDALIALAADAGLATVAELTSGQADPNAKKQVPDLTADKVPPAMRRGGSTRREVSDITARFAPGDDVQARNMSPRGHTRLPRYVRGRRGVIDRVHGAFVLPDTNAALAGEHPQPVYSVRFTARELWGDDAPHPADKIYVDMWDSYLEPG
jgi:nitrile hydratase